MTGTPEGSTESGFMEKPGIEPATPGLQGIALIHYTTGASLESKNAGTSILAKLTLDNVFHYKEQLTIYIYKLILNTLGLA